MKRLWTSSRAVITLLLLAVLLGFQGAMALPMEIGAANQSKLWTQAEALADHLIEERRKLDGLFGEVEKLRFICEDLRDMQLYPATVSHLNRDDDIEFDKAIESLEKRIAKFHESVSELESPLVDAIYIAGQMVDEKLNRDMLDLLQQDNLKRVAKLIALQKELEARWDGASLLLEKYRQRSGTPQVSADSGSQEEAFFHVLQNSVGLSSDGFYQSMHQYKDELAKRGTNRDWELMAKVDLDRLQNRISTHAIERVRKDLSLLKKRFDGKMAIGLIEFTLASTSLASGKPLDAAQIYMKVNTDSKVYSKSRLGSLQAYFAGNRDDSVVALYERFISEQSLKNEDLASARYLEIQSLYELKRDKDLERIALQSSLTDPWYARNMLIYGRSLVRNERHAEARSVFSKINGDPKQPQEIRNRGGLALAHLNFEDHFHEQALKGYRDLLDQEAMQAEALYGMVWCNIRLGDLDAAEFILKKLISQHPDDPWAMEGFMVLVRKMLYKAREEWTWQGQYLRQMEKLNELAIKLQDPASALSDESKTRLRLRVDSAKSSLNKQPPASADAITNLYQQALNLCDFLETRYRTGEYSERTFRTDREKVLLRLRQAATKNLGDSTFSITKSTDSRKAIFEKLFEARSLTLDIHIMYRTWLSELLRNCQLELRHEMDTLGTDSLSELRRVALEKQGRVLADDIGERIAAKGDDILNRITALAEDPNSALSQDWLLFQRGYLLYVREEDNVRGIMAAKRWVHATNASEIHSLDEDPEVDFRVYEEPWLDLLRRYPQSKWAPAALYYLGYSMSSRGESDRGLEYFETLSKEHPESIYAQQALIFIGEHYFNENQLSRAETAYDKVLDYPESRYFDQALYKLAWTRYRRNSYKSAISSFSYILDESLRKNGEKRGLLAGEALQYTALSLAEADTSGEGGWTEGMQFADRFGNAKVGAELLHKMALIYLQQGRLERARRSLESLMKMYPTYSKTPEVLMDLAQAFDKSQDFEQAAVLRERVFRSYLPETDAYKAITDKARRIEIDTLLQNANTLAVRHHLFEARKIKAEDSEENVALRDTHYHKALALLETWRVAFIKDPRTMQNLYQQAEIHYALGEFASAARKYMQVSRMNSGPLRTMSAYNAIVAAQELQRKSEKKHAH
jgi:TolA-binding protein